MFKKTILFLLILTLIGSCKKQYPDDRWKHINSPFKRLTRTSWSFTKHEFLTPNSYQYSSQSIYDYLEFLKDGSCLGGTSTLPANMIYLYDFRGTWEFVENESKIKITYKRNPSYSKLWTIQRLDRGVFIFFCDSIKYTLNPE
jgi:hypothetical protein